MNAVNWQTGLQLGAQRCFSSQDVLIGDVFLREKQITLIEKITGCITVSAFLYLVDA